MDILIPSAAIALVLLLIIGSIYYLFSDAGSENTASTTSIPPENRPLLVGDRFRIIGAQELIALLSLEPSLAHIKANLGLSEENWQQDALPFLKNYIEFVQRLPASESHHHAGDGGLVKHTLDVASLALIASTAQSWPPNAKTEDIAQKTAVWRYGIMCAAILHDVGKTVTGFQIELYSDANTQDYSLWLPDAGRMQDTGKEFYRVVFPDAKNAYQIHAEIAWTFFQGLVPAHVRQWIAANDPNLMIALRQYLSNHKENHPLHDLITKADMASVARDLKAGSRQRFGTAKRVPLIETVMETLKEMLADRGAHFSIAATAGGDLFRVGDKVYMISKNVPDYIRQYLRSQNNRAAASFPTDNQRIFDTLLEYGAVIPDEQDEYRAVRTVEVVFTRTDGEIKTNLFTVLCFKLDTLYPDGSYPSEFQGRLNTVAAGTHKSARTQEAHTKNTDTKEHLVEQHLIEPAFPEAETVLETVEESSPTPIPEPPPVIPPPPKKRDTNQTTAKPSAKNSIDDLLSDFGLLTEADTSEEVENESNARHESESPQKSDTAIPEQLETQATIANTEKTAAAAVILNTGEPTFSKPPKAVNTPQGRLKKLKHLFDETEASPTADKTILPQETLAVDESAKAGLEEITRKRQQLPTSTPRPVQIHQDLTLAAVQADADIEAAKPETTREETEQNALTQVNLEMREIGAQFLNWLANGLADSSIAVNQSGAPVHFIEQGMLLVSPTVFREYAGGVFDRRDAKSAGPMAQKGFERLKLHSRTRSTALFRAVTTNENKKILFHCYLIPEHNIKHIIQPASRPQNNTSIQLDNSNLLKME